MQHFKEIEEENNLNNIQYLQITKAEHLQIWFIKIFIRIFNEVIPLTLSIVLALTMAFISSNFDYLMNVALHSIENIGRYRYFTCIMFMSLSAFVVQVVHPTVRGSGIPEMKLFMCNWESPRMKDYLSFRAFITKIIGLGLAILSGFPVGKEGPFVHIACAVSYHLKFQLFPKVVGWFNCNCGRFLVSCDMSFVKSLSTKIKAMSTEIFKQHYQDWKLHYLREVDVYRSLCTGCALGVACTFGAPIGGVMFSIEVTSNMFDIASYWHCFFTGMTGALFFRFFLGGMFHENWFFKPFLKSNLPGEEYEIGHFFVYIGIGIACGIIGAVFILVYYVFFKCGQIIYRILNFLFKKLSTKTMTFIPLCHHRTSPRRIIVSVLFTMIMATILSIGEFIQNQDYKMPASQHSQLALFFDDGKKLMQDFRIMSTENITSVNMEIDVMMNYSNYLRPLLLFLFMKILFFCPIVTCLPVPTGIFFPLMVTGACIGRLLGDLSKISSAGCAIVGAAALSGAVTHSVSTAVIITEMTEEIQYLVPCAIAAFVGKMISQIIAKYSIYDMIMRVRRMPYMPDEDEDIYHVFKKTDAIAFFTSNNVVSMISNISGKNKQNCLYCHSVNDVLRNSDESICSTNEQLQAIVSSIHTKTGEVQWKLIPVLRQSNNQEFLVGYVRCEAAYAYLQKYFELIMKASVITPWWMKSAEYIDNVCTENDNQLLEASRKCLGFPDLCEYKSTEWREFLLQDINLEELLEEKPCSVTETTKLPEIQNFVQKNFLPQVFVMQDSQLRGVITRENIIEQIKQLHRRSGSLAISYRGDLGSLPNTVKDPNPDSKTNSKTNGIQYNKAFSATYSKLRTHSE